MNRFLKSVDFLTNRIETHLGVFKKINKNYALKIHSNPVEFNSSRYESKIRLKIRIKIHKKVLKKRLGNLKLCQ